MTDISILWQTAFNKAIGEQQEKTDSNPTDWRAGGRATKDWPNKQNGDWWAVNGEQMVADFVTWWAASGNQVWTAPSGDSGVELGMVVDFDGIPVKAFADLVMVTHDGELAVMDYKTGASTPETSMQLGLYAVCVEKMFGVRPQVGYFYSARDAVAKPAENMHVWTYDLFCELFRQFELGLKNRIFLPNAGINCRTCGVAEYCHVNGGSLAHLYDSLHPSQKILKEGI